MGVYDIQYINGCIYKILMSIWITKNFQEIGVPSKPLDCSFSVPLNKCIKYC